MSKPFILKVITENNKRFIISLESTATTNHLIKEVKKYFRHYFKTTYSVKYVYSSDKFIIFDNLPISTFYKNEDICYIKGIEGDPVSVIESDIDNKVEYDIHVKRFKSGPTFMKSTDNLNKKDKVTDKKEKKHKLINIENESSLHKDGEWCKSGNFEKGPLKIFKKIPLLNPEDPKIASKKKPGLGNSQPENKKPALLEKITNEDTKETTNMIDTKETTNMIDIKETTNMIYIKETTNMIDIKETTNMIDNKETTNMIDVKEISEKIDTKEISEKIDVKETSDKLNYKEPEIQLEDNNFPDLNYDDDDIKLEKYTKKDKEVNPVDSPNKKKNNKNERNYNVKNGFNPNTVLKVTSLDNKNKLSNRDTSKQTDRVINKKLEDIKESDKPLDKQIDNQNDNKSDKLFVLENTNKKKPVVEMKGIKKMVKKKKINYDEL